MTEKQISGTLQTAEKDGIAIISIEGYFDEEIGLKLAKIADAYLRSRILKIIVNLEGCELINSLGVTQLLDLAIRTVEDYKGAIVMVTSRPVILRVLELASLSQLATMIPTLDEALKYMKE